MIMERWKNVSTGKKLTFSECYFSGELKYQELPRQTNGSENISLHLSPQTLKSQNNPDVLKQKSTVYTSVPNLMNDIRIFS